jgi:2-haloacid dehalogenase
MPKIIIFDIIGTLVSHTNFIPSITTRIGPSLASHSLSPTLFAYAWIEAAEHEHALLASSGQTTTLPVVLQSIFFRVLHFAGVSDPHSVATSDDIRFMVGEYTRCEVRDGAGECIEQLRTAGWEVYAFTDGQREEVNHYFETGNIDIDDEHVITCADVGVKKPVLSAYEKVKQRIGIKEGDEVWFAAAHAWDVSAARRAGFKTAYCLVLEGEAMESVYGKMDVVAEGLVELVERVLKAAK